MPLFEKNKSSSRSAMNNVRITDVIKDIKYSSIKSENSKKLIEEGYLEFIKPKDNFDGNTCYYVKPTTDVKKHMKTIGYGEVSGIEYMDISNTISFHSTWKSNSISMTTTPQIAGVIDGEELKKTLKEIDYEGHCQVDKAYSRMYDYNPNYALNSINFSGDSLEKMKNLSRNIWLATGFMLNDNEITKKANNGDYDMAFKDKKSMDFLNSNFSFEKPLYIPKNQSKKIMRP
jgi:hypothetical protein